MAVTEAMHERIEAERLEAADMEWQRHHRMALVLLCSLEITHEDWTKAAKRHALDGEPLGLLEIQHMMDRVQGVVEVMKGEWLMGPKEMLARRQKERAT